MVTFEQFLFIRDNFGKETLIKMLINKDLYIKKEPRIAVVGSIKMFNRMRYKNIYRPFYNHFTHIREIEQTKGIEWDFVLFLPHYFNQENWWEIRESCLRRGAKLVYLQNV